MDDPLETLRLSDSQVMRLRQPLNNPREQNPPALLAIDGAPEPTLLVLTPGETTIGRDGDNSQVLKCDGISRHHLKIEVSADFQTVTATDLGSRNGTWLNKKRMEKPTVLRRGDLLHLGLAIFRFLPFGDPDLGNAYTRNSLYAMVREGDEPHLQEQLELITGLSSAFATSIDLQETLFNSLLQITTYLEAEAASLFLREGGGKRMVCRAAVGPVDITGLVIDSHEGIIGRTLRDGVSQRVADVSRDPTFSGRIDDTTGFVTRSILCAPLRIGSDTFGVMEIINKKNNADGFKERDRSVLSALASSAALAIHSANLAEKQLHGERVRKELELASALQKSFFPKKRGDAYPVQGINVPAREVSGDFFDIVPVFDDTIFFAIGDVSGKGINAALLTAKTSSLLRFLGRNVSDPAAILQAVNRELAGIGTMGMFVTVQVGFYDLNNGRVHFANAGHPPPIVHLGEDRFKTLPLKSLPLGIIADRTFPKMTHHLQQGTMYLYSDGLVEGKDANGTPLEQTGLQEVIRRHAGLPTAERLQKIAATVDTSSGERFDDVTLLIVEPSRPHA